MKKTIRVGLLLAALTPIALAASAGADSSIRTAAALPAADVTVIGAEGDRVQALRAAAVAVGVSAGRARVAYKVNAVLEAEGDALSRGYDFNDLVLHGAGGALVMPPVVVASGIEGGGTRYEIVVPTGFVGRVPSWRDYLVQDAVVEDPGLRPEGDAEKAVWRQAVKEGWNQGVGQQLAKVEDDFRRLERDYSGMVRPGSAAKARDVAGVERVRGMIARVAEGEDVGALAPGRASNASADAGGGSPNVPRQQ